MGHSHHGIIDKHIPTGNVHDYSYFGQKLLMVCDDHNKIHLKLVLKTNTSWHFVSSDTLLSSHRSEIWMLSRERIMFI